MASLARACEPPTSAGRLIIVLVVRARVEATACDSSSLLHKRTRARKTGARVIDRPQRAQRAYMFAAKSGASRWLEQVCAHKNVKYARSLRALSRDKAARAHNRGELRARYLFYIYTKACLCSCSCARAR